jgi:hypothetical protein
MEVGLVSSAMHHAVDEPTIVRPFSLAGWRTDFPGSSLARRLPVCLECFGRPPFPRPLGGLGALADGNKAGQRINMDTEEERSNRLVAQSELTLSQWGLPPPAVLFQ